MAQQVGSFAIEVRFNASDLQRIEARLNGSKGRIQSGLTSRVQAMGQAGAAALNAGAPHGSDGDWRRGEPPLSESHHFVQTNSAEGYLYTDAPHAPFIVFGFEPHMPPEEAWTGEPNEGYFPRLSVLARGTPTNPVDYWSPVEAMLEGENQHWAEVVGALWLGG